MSNGDENQQLKIENHNEKNSPEKLEMVELNSSPRLYANSSFVNDAEEENDPKINPNNGENEKSDESFVKIAIDNPLTEPMDVKVERTNEPPVSKLNLLDVLISMRDKILIIINSDQFSKIFLICLAILFVVYFIICMCVNFPFYFFINSSTSSSSSAEFLDNHIFANNKGLGLLSLTTFILTLIVWDRVIVKYLGAIKFDFKFSESKFFKEYFGWTVKLILVACIAVYFFFNMDSIYNFISLLGLFFYFAICILISVDPRKINWSTVTSGILMQIILCIFVIRIEFGLKLLKFLSEKVIEFLDCTDSGSELVFGKNFKEHYFVFKACAVIVFFSAMINVCNHYGLLEYVILKLSWVVNKIMHTSPTESVCATANIFIGQTEAPLIVRPFIEQMTESELFALMLGGFASSAGSVLAAYVGFGAPANHIVIASFLAAPCSLTLSKTLFPETRKTVVDWEYIRNIPKYRAYNLFEAISTGASSVLKVVGVITVNLIAFTAFFKFLDTAVKWLLSVVNFKNFGLAEVFQYVFWPLALMMGVNIEDCKQVSSLIGIKVFINEFVAYSRMGEMINLRNNLTNSNTFELYRNGTYTLPVGTPIIWNDRSIVIATYALCGFSNFASIGLQISVLSTLAPNKANFFPRIALLAMIGGNIANFINGCIVGIMYRQN